MSTNSVVLVGNLVEDPELRFTPSGVPMAKLRFAVNRRWKDQGGRVAGGNQLFRRHPLARPCRERSREPPQGRPGDRGRPARTAILGDPGRREAVGRRSVDRGDRAEPALGDRQRQQDRQDRAAATSLPARFHPARSLVRTTAPTKRRSDPLPQHLGD